LKYLRVWKKLNSNNFSKGSTQANNTLLNIRREIDGAADEVINEIADNFICNFLLFFKQFHRETSPKRFVRCYARFVSTQND